MNAIKIFNDWLPLLKEEFEQDYMKNLRQFLASELSQKKPIYPPPSQMFRALNSTSFADTRVVILGQDPYHGAGEAEGLCFSVANGVRTPPSLQNIFKEIESDLQIKNRISSLESWANQGILLLNSVLSVEKDRAASHSGKGWEQFTDKIISLLNDRREDLVFILWGNYAINKGRFIDAQKHLIIKSPHPSPLSASRGFFGSRPFSKTNEFLRAKGLSEIDWQTK